MRRKAWLVLALSMVGFVAAEVRGEEPKKGTRGVAGALAGEEPGAGGLATPKADRDGEACPVRPGDARAASSRELRDATLAALDALKKFILSLPLGDVSDVALIDTEALAEVKDGSPAIAGGPGAASVANARGNPNSGGGGGGMAYQPAWTPDAGPFGPGQAVPPIEGRLDTTGSDEEVLARIVKGECPAHMPREGKLAVAGVVVNRAKLSGKTIPEVAHAPYQFSCYNAEYRDKLYWGTIPEWAREIARTAIAGAESPMPGATHYYNPYLVQPSWAKSMVYLGRIGNDRTDTHVFYRGSYK